VARSALNSPERGRWTHCELRGSFTLTPGTHQFVFCSYDAAGIGNQLVTPVTVP